MAFLIKLKLNYLSVVTPNFLFGYQEYLNEDLLPLHSFKLRKNTPVLVSITDREAQVSRDAQNVCAIAIAGTVLN